MAMKDEEYLKRNILAVYYKHEPQYTNLPYYRFMGQKELETLFFNKEAKVLVNMAISL